MGKHLDLALRQCIGYKACPGRASNQSPSLAERISYDLNFLYNSGEVEAAGTGVGIFSGEGDVNFAGDFPAGVFMGDGRAQFNGAGQIWV